MKENQVEDFNKKNVRIGISEKSYGRTYFANRKFKKGEIVMYGFGEMIGHQTPHISVQIDINKHYLPQSWTGRYWNHSCNPNTHIKTRADGFPNLVASKSIEFGEEITYSYWMSELQWIKNADENKIKCKCREKTCKRKILSFSQLPDIEQKNMKNKKICSKYLLHHKFTINLAK